MARIKGSRGTASKAFAGKRKWTAPKRVQIRSQGTMTQRHVSGPTFVKLRFRSTAPDQYNLRGYQLLGAMGSYALNTSLVYPIFESARLLNVKIVGAPPIQGATSEVKLEISGGQASTTNPRDLIINSSNNPNTNPQIYATPSKFSQGGQFFNAAATGPVVSFSVPANSIIEMAFMANLYEDGNTMTSYSPATAVAGGTFVHPNIYTSLEVLA